MLGQALKRVILEKGDSFTGLAKDGGDINVDITDDNAFLQALDVVKPDIVINAAALTDCNTCDRDPGLAYRVNARPSSLLADWSRRNGTYYVYISTDHYFSGDGDKMHAESAPVVLLNEYARSKYLGEVLTATNPETLIVRTNIVGFRGWTEPTFLEWAIDVLKKETLVTLFDDYYTSSIPVSLFSERLYDLISKRPKGTVNLACRETSSKRRFVEGLAGKLGLSTVHVSVGSVRNLQVCRAESLGLDVSLAESLLGRPLPDLNEVLEQIAHDYQEVA